MSERLRSERLESGGVMSDLPRVGGGQPRSLLDSSANPRIGSATADVAAHRVIDILVGRPRLLIQQRRGGHDLSRLAVAALHDIERQPGVLHFLTSGGVAD